MSSATRGGTSPTDYRFPPSVFSRRVIQSKNPAFPVGSHVVGRCGWRSHTVCDSKDLVPIMPGWPQDVSLSLALGAIGMPG